MPAMVIALRDPDGDVLGFHLTFIEDGKKHSTLYTSGENGNAVGRLSDVTEYINIAEGAENAMSVSVLTGQACWAALDANRLEKFIPPAGTKGVNIYADVDHNHRGEIAAHKLAANLHSMGIAVKVIADLERGRDWNDRIQSLRD
jgi:phage/plasmid primase-like uncharacterized protein